MESFKHPQRLEDNIAVWSELKEIQLKYNGLSLGEGAPEEAPPKFVQEAVVEAMNEGHNQYFRTFGHPAICNAVSKQYSKKFEREIHPMKEVLISPGANGALHAFLLAFLNKGDEVVVIEPCFPLYLDHIRLSDATIKHVPLEIKDNGKFELNLDILRKAFSDKTKIFLWNNPNNPTGKNYTREEIEAVSIILEEFPHVVVISDEVYDFLVFDQGKHTLFANVRNNWNKTISIFSGGKLFSATGWKVGWSIGPENLIRMGGIIANTTFYCSGSIQQVAFGKTLHKLTEPGYEGELSFQDCQRRDFQEARDLLINTLKENPHTKIEPINAEAGYFVMADISKLEKDVPDKYKTQLEYEDDPNTLVTKYDLRMPNGQIPLD